MATVLALNGAFTVQMEIENQHQRLVELVNRLYKEIDGRRRIWSITTTLDELMDYLHVHFVFEEYYLLRLNCYVHITDKAEHEAIIRRVLAFQTNFRLGDYKMAMELFQFLQKWLMEHLIEWESCRPTLVERAIP